MTKPWNAPISAPRMRPDGERDDPGPRKVVADDGGRISACDAAMIMPMKPRIDPTDRSMLRDTMTSTMPVAMMATVAVCTEGSRGCAASGTDRWTR